MSKYEKLFAKCNSEFSITRTYYENLERVKPEERQQLKDAYLSASLEFFRNVPSNVMTE